ncbi:MAG: hypothetical protein U9O18_01265 [Chloroflexota bacterium]|nr:hypothetical protein [Chloroflexota bacterium]
MPHPPTTSTPDIRIDFSHEMGVGMKRLHGVNNGPIGYGSLIDVSHHYGDMGVPSVRLHDPNWPHPREVDIYAVFPDFEADLDDPRSYDFARTDDYVGSVLETGAQIVYRLGVSIEHTKVKTYTHPPADYDRWARVCVRIIDHYNEGWADGFRYGIDYWEIWNEPDVPAELMWSGTPEEYFELYRVAATAIKSTHPGVKVGGPGSARARGELARHFVAFCAEERLPLNFFSWHIYTDRVSDVTDLALVVRELLDAHGFAATESHLNEWNYFDADFWTMWKKGHERERSRVFGRQKSPVGAAFAAGTLLALQDSRVDVANYYDGQPSALFCGLFDPYGVPQKTFYAFKAFRALCDAGARVEATVGSEAAGLFAGAAARPGGEGVALISNVSGPSREYRIHLDGLATGTRYDGEIYRIDAEHDLDRVGTIQLDPATPTLDLAIAADSGLLLRLRLS